MNTTPATDATPTTDAARPRDRHVVLRHRLKVDGGGAVLLGGGFLVVVLLFVTGLSFFTDIRVSGWEAGTQLVRWFVGAVGVYLTAVHLPLYVVHGRTRREVAADCAAFAIVYAAVAATVVTIGFAVERVVYRIAGWTHGLQNEHLFDTVGQWHLIALEHVLVLAVWAAGGAMLGAAFYRNSGLGMLLAPVAVAAVALTEEAGGPGAIGPVPPPVLDLLTLGSGTASPVAATATAAGCWIALTAVTWLIVRDTPIRNQTP